MEKAIDLNIVEGFLQCPYKAHLLSIGKTGEQSAYELLMSELKTIYGSKFRDIATKTSRSIIFECEMRLGGFHLKIDALESVAVDDCERQEYKPFFFCRMKELRLRRGS